jgi:aspartyl-tRNA(Asn)/glutamyl-tRNA(Gln) amidotransferase subunit C
MAIPREEVERIAALARLSLTPERLDRLAAELSRVLEFVETLGDDDADGAETPATAADALRDDVVDGRRLGPDVVAAMAPEAEDGFVIVPPIVEHLEP